jgi:hypothetical protein
MTRQKSNPDSSDMIDGADLAELTGPDHGSTEERGMPATTETVPRTARSLYVVALDVLLKGRMAYIAVERDWDLLEEVARLATDDAPTDLAVTDPSLFEAWRTAVTKYHLKGWTNMTPERVRQVRDRAAERKRAISLIDRQSADGMVEEGAIPIVNSAHRV